MIDFILDVFFTPSPVWAGIALGFLAATGAWLLLPGNIDRASVGAWCVAAGFIGGLVYCFVDWSGREGK